MREKVKSARRVMQLLEYFDEIRSDASVTDISRGLGIPQSSTTELLRSLTELGYLAQLPGTRRYRPTHRVALLGTWIPAPYLAEGRLVQMMEHLGEVTRETIILGEQSNTVMRYIYVVPSRQPMRLHVGPGTERPVARSGLGKLFLSTLPERKVRDILKRVEAERRPDEPGVIFSEIEPELAEIRRRGYHLTTRGVNPGAGIVGMMLPDSPGHPTLALGIGGLAENISSNAERLVAAMRAGIRDYLG